jgi:hypothetical protein
VAGIAPSYTCCEHCDQSPQATSPVSLQPGEAYHTALQTGAADSILDSLRPVFNEHVEAIEEARDLIPAETDLKQWLATAKPAAITAWQGLSAHLDIVDRVGRFAANFGARPTARFPLLIEFAGGDTFRISDVALFCVNGPSLAADSAPFLRLGPTEHRASPWFRVSPLRLNSVAQAAERYQRWCESEWDRTHAGSVGSWVDEKGEAHELPRPKNPYATKALAKG